jgi:hypothetical protein
MKPSFTQLSDNGLEEYLRGLNIDALEKKLHITCDNIIDLKEELKDLDSYKHLLTRIIEAKRHAS